MADWCSVAVAISLQPRKSKFGWVTRSTARDRGRYVTRNPNVGVAYDSPMSLFVVILVLFLPSLAEPVGVRPHYTASWAVEIDGGEGEAERLAVAHGLVNRGQVRRRQASLARSEPTPRWGV